MCKKPLASDSFTFLSVTGTLFRRCPWSSVSQRFVPGRGSHAWSDRSKSAWRSLRGTCHCTSSHIWHEWETDRSLVYRKECANTTTSSEAFIRAYLPLFAFVERVLVHRLVVPRPDVVQTAVVSKCPPLHVDTHTTLSSVHYLDVLRLLHVTGVTSCPWEDARQHPISVNDPQL